MPSPAAQPRIRPSVVEPAIFLDGVRMRGLGQALEVLRQIPASDVKDIQVLRGPAAAFIQGSANGAILIETKFGLDGGE